MGILYFIQEPCLSVNTLLGSQPLFSSSIEKGVSGFRQKSSVNPVYAKAVITQHAGRPAAYTQECTSRSSGGGKAKIKVPAVWVSGGNTSSVADDLLFSKFSGGFCSVGAHSWCRVPSSCKNTVILGQPHLTASCNLHLHGKGDYIQTRAPNKSHWGCSINT